MTPDTLHTHLRTVIEERLIIARAADEDWAGVEAPDSWPETVVDFADAHGPADAVRRYEADLERLEMHKPAPCDECERCRSLSEDGIFDSWPCTEIRILASSLGIEVSE